MSRCAQNLRQNASHASAFGLNPWCTWSAASGRPPSWARRSSSATESTPPENPTQIAAPGGRSAARLLGQFLELAIVHPAFLAALEERVRGEVLEAAQVLLDGLLQALGRFRM